MVTCGALGRAWAPQEGCLGRGREERVQRALGLRSLPSLLLNSLSPSCWSWKPWGVCNPDPQAHPKAGVGLLKAPRLISRVRLWLSPAGPASTPCLQMEKLRFSRGKGGNPG